MSMDHPALLDAMMADQANQKDVHKPGSYWMENARTIAAAIKSHGLAKFRSNHAISKGYADSVSLNPFEHWHDSTWRNRLLKAFTANPIVQEKLLDPCLELIEYYYDNMCRYRQYYYEQEFGPWLEANYLENNLLPETTACACQENVRIRGRDISINYIKHLIRIHNFAAAVDFHQIDSALEIGGGFGANAHLLLHLHPNLRKFLYIDIPPMLYVATQYLRRFFPDHVTDYLQTRGRGEISFRDDSSLEILALCPWQLERFHSPVQLAWNSASFQEMEQDIIANYARRIQQLAIPGKTTLCLAIYRLAKPKNTRSAKEIIDIFKSKFQIRELNPALVWERPADFFVGTRSQ